MCRWNPWERREWCLIRRLLWIWIIDLNSHLYRISVLFLPDKGRMTFWPPSSSPRVGQKSSGLLLTPKTQGARAQEAEWFQRVELPLQSRLTKIPPPSASEVGLLQRAVALVALEESCDVGRTTADSCHGQHLAKLWGWQCHSSGSRRESIKSERIILQPNGMV